MKIVFAIVIIFLFSIISNAQSQTVSEDEYRKAFQFAISETNADYPLIFKVTTKFFENGKLVRTSTEVNENESAGHYRIKRTNIEDGKETNKYQITFGFGNV